MSIVQKSSAKNSQSLIIYSHEVKKNCFLHFKHIYLAIYMVKFVEISFTHSYTSLVQDPLVKYTKK